MKKVNGCFTASREREGEHTKRKSVIVKIRYAVDGLPRIATWDIGDWIDLRSGETVQLRPGDYLRISLGVAMELPEGYEAIVAARSSTFEKYGCIPVNGIGIIDNSYKGNDDIWCLPVYATRTAKINKGDRIAQFRIQKRQPLIDFDEVDDLQNPNRHGFGSTGVK